MTLLQVRDVHKDWMTVTWQPPKDDGGSEIKYYIVEKQDQVGSHFGMISSYFITA